MSHNYLLCQVHGDEPAGKPGILLMRQTKTDRSISPHGGRGLHRAGRSWRWPVFEVATNGRLWGGHRGPIPTGTYSAAKKPNTSQRSIGDSPASIFMVAGLFTIHRRCCARFTPTPLYDV